MKIPETQTSGGDECLRYAVAAVFELPVAQVPHFIKLPGDWVANLRAWASERGFSATFAFYQTSRRSTWHYVRHDLPTGHFIAVIAPFSRGRAHAVVMDGTRVVYDPARNYSRKRYQKRGMGVIEFVPVNA